MRDLQTIGVLSAQLVILFQNCRPYKNKLDLGQYYLPNNVKKTDLMRMP